MEEKRAKTLEALWKFIDSQKTLLAQTRSDIERLQELRKEVLECPEDALACVTERVDASVSNLSQQDGLVPSIPPEIDWDLYKSCDPSPLHALAAESRRAYEQRNQPSAHQRSELSDLQKLVKGMRTDMVDTVLATYSYLNEPASDDEPAEVDPETIKRELEREKIKELKKKRIEGGLSTRVLPGTRRPRAANGVFIRRDQDDESAEVDVWDDRGEADADGERSLPGSSSEPILMDVDTPPTSVASPSSVKIALPPVVPLALDKPVRQRRLSKKAQAVYDQPAMSTHARGKAAPKQKPKEEEPEPSSPAFDEENSSRGKVKPKSETYKQAWSVSEQHLLERLLEEIPDGAKNRWLKISQAMNGRRTPRQVASRVQKYFEKLKRFGVEIGSSK